MTLLGVVAIVAFLLGLIIGLIVAVFCVQYAGSKTNKTWIRRIAELQAEVEGL